jgi:hypothetical protein
MKRMFARLAALVFVSALALPALAGEAGGKVSATGYIVDSHCAKMSSEAGKPVCCKKDAVAGSAEFSKCIVACAKEKDVKLGMMIKDTFWTFDNQDLARQNLGVEVTVTGTTDPATKTLKIDLITKADEKKS